MAMAVIIYNIAFFTYEKSKLMLVPAPRMKIAMVVWFVVVIMTMPHCCNAATAKLYIVT